MEVIFNFSRYEELRQAVIQLLQENIDSELLYEEAEDLFDSWWNSNNHSGILNEDEKQRVWQVLTNEFGHKLVKAGG
ncbi:hypothetical protein [Synechococcus sp. CC9616]|uniref:hypothetical protein n=1 Tax=Synechococcus sp. CC9616 TaxID=110663 RepID=UPI00048D9FB6|nr:hypothetical protein [Synechococcus sp. CC9616]